MARSVFQVKEHDIPKIPMKNWILALLHGEEHNKPSDFHFIMYQTFIFSREILHSEGSEFEMLGYGPFSKEVAECIDQLLSSNMLDKRKDKSVIGIYGFDLTEKGKKKAEKILSEFPKNLRGDVDYMKFLTSKMSHCGMIQYIYSLYPEYVHLKKGWINLA